MAFACKRCEDWDLWIWEYRFGQKDLFVQGLGFIVQVHSQFGCKSCRAGRLMVERRVV